MSSFLLGRYPSSSKWNPSKSNNIHHPLLLISTPSPILRPPPSRARLPRSLTREWAASSTRRRPTASPLLRAM